MWLVEEDWGAGGGGGTKESRCCLGSISSITDRFQAALAARKLCHQAAACLRWLLSCTLPPCKFQVAEAVASHAYMSRASVFNPPLIIHCLAHFCCKQ